MKVLFGAMIALLICSCTDVGHRSDERIVREFLARPIPEFKFTYTFDASHDRVVVELTASPEELCLPVEQWPSARGTVDQGARRVAIVTGTSRIEAASDRFADCAGGCGYLKVQPGKPLIGFVSLEQFVGLDKSDLDNSATLTYELKPFVCEASMRIAQPRN